MISSKDFFFNTIIRQEPSIDVSDLNKLLATVDTGYFAYQVNRMLSRSGDNVCTVFSTSSSPCVSNIITALSGLIAMVHIYAVKPQNPVVNATLTCDLYLPDGILRLLPQWNASEPKDVVNLATSLAVPLILNKMHDKTFIKTQDVTEKLYFNSKLMMDQLIKLALYNPAAYIPSEYEQYITNAQKAVAMGGDTETIQANYERINKDI